MGGHPRFVGGAGTIARKPKLRRSGSHPAPLFGLLASYVRIEERELEVGGLKKLANAPELVTMLTSSCRPV